jgi:DNA invertase Pin-like site-specific DNA recombinase
MKAGTGHGNFLNEGRAEAKLKGIKFGRKRTIDREKIIALYRAGTGVTEIAKHEKVGRSTVYKLLREESSKKIEPQSNR